MHLFFNRSEIATANNFWLAF